MKREVEEAAETIAHAAADDVERSVFGFIGTLTSYPRTNLELKLKAAFLKGVEFGVQFCTGRANELLVDDEQTH